MWIVIALIFIIFSASRLDAIAFLHGAGCRLVMQVSKACTDSASD
jgi:hypothetical protein